MGSPDNLLSRDSRSSIGGSPFDAHSGEEAGYHRCFQTSGVSTWGGGKGNEWGLRGEGVASLLSLLSSSRSYLSGSDVWGKAIVDT
eukprot:1395528-Amorphochlora_amoeboformis.AAC.2